MNPSEFELIGQIADRAPAAARFDTGIGDDAAVIRTRGRIVTSVDTAVAGVHFDPGRPAVESARKAVASAVSDLAAMGLGTGETELLVALGAPKDTPREYLEGLVEGVLAAAGEFGAALAGGDIVSSPVVFLSVTAIAHVNDSIRLTGRSDARPGDLVALTGPVGGAAAGLALLGGLEVPDLSELAEDLLVRCQVRPEPQLKAAPVLAAGGVSAMIDVSDGLIADLGHIAEASGVGIRLEAARIPVYAGVAEVASAAGRDPFEFAVTGGEDYVLALTVAPDAFAGVDDALIGATGFELQAIGEVVAGEHASGLVSVRSGGRTLDLGATGHDHFR